MSKHKKANKPYEITNGDTSFQRKYTNKKDAKTQLKFAGKVSMKFRKINIYEAFKVQERTDGVYAK